MRDITIDGKVWRYKIGASFAKIVSPDRHGMQVPLMDIATGVSWDTLERGRHKRTSDGMVTPAMVRAWIERNKTKIEKET